MHQADQLAVAVREATKLRLATLRGNLTADTAWDVERKLVDRWRPDQQMVVLDVRNVDAVDAAGLGLIQRIHLRARAVGKRFVVVCLPGWEHIDLEDSGVEVVELPMGFELPAPPRRFPFLIWSRNRGWA
jgi:anti-anti-sigma regulatory factor